MWKSFICLGLPACLLVLTTFVYAGEPHRRVDLKGSIHDSEQKPVSGASVWKAGVKQDYSTYCPSCYLDCGKNDHERGRFL